MLIAYPERPSIVGVGASGFIIGLSMLLRFVGAATLVPAFLYLLLRRLGAARAVALIAGFAIPLGAYSLYFSTQRGGSFGVTDSNGLSLRAGRRIRRLRRGRDAEEPKEYCPAGPIESETKGVFTSVLEIDKPWRFVRTIEEADPHEIVRTRVRHRPRVGLQPSSPSNAARRSFSGRTRTSSTRTDHYWPCC
jgi:hypothetical protein